MPFPKFQRTALLMAGCYALYWLFYQFSDDPYTAFVRDAFNFTMGIVLCVLYWHGYHVIKETPSFKWPLLLLFFMLIAFISLWSNPFHSTDLFGYINRGWQQLTYDTNPYITTVNQIQNWQQDEMFTNHWVHNPCPYGFLFAWYAKSLCLMGNGNLFWTAVLFKVMNAGSLLLTGLLLYSASRRMGSAHPELALYLCLFNPLLILHHLINGHNDILMALFMVLAGYCTIRRAWLWILPSLTAGLLIKWLALLCIPLACLYLIRQKQIKAMIFGGILSLALGLVLATPYLTDWQTLRLHEMEANAMVTVNSFHSLFYFAYKSMATWLTPLQSGLPLFGKLLQLVLWGAFVLFYGWRLYHVFRTSEATAWIQESVLVFAVFLGVVSSKFYPWYLGMILPMALLLREGHLLRQVLLAVSCAQLFAITFLGRAHMLNYLLLTALPTALIFDERQRHLLKGTFQRFVDLRMEVK